uniref:Heme-binding protein soul5 n=1 Tax=Neogobius melanostomus TaxID=47308 RepID=A0A8C6SMS5_9GOBI
IVGYVLYPSESPCTDTPECLLFELVCKTKDYEIRRYDSVNWVSTSFKTRAKVWWLDLMALVPAFRRMKNYHNGKSVNISTNAMVAPGMVKIPERKGSWMSKLVNTQEYSLNFLLPSFHQSNYTEPTNKEVEIVTTPEMYVYVKPYKGWLNEDATQAQLLFKSLGMSSDVTPHWAVAYSSPMSSKPHSEVWVIADGKPTCPPSGK